MARALFTNNATSTLLAGINNSVTSLSVASGHGARFPAVTAGNYFYATLAEGSLVEIVKVTARTTDAFTVTRAQDGTTGQTFTTAATVKLNVNREVLAELASIPQLSKSVDYTFILGDEGCHILHPSADTTARTFTIPANASVAFRIGTAITFVNQVSAGVVTIAITTDTMRLAGAGTTGSRTLAANGVATALKITSTEWIVSGTNLT